LRRACFVLARSDKSFGIFVPFNFFNFDAFDCECPFPENSVPYDSERLARGLHLHERWAEAMLKISILDTSSQRRLLIEGKLIGPWATELARVWRQATVDLNDRALVIDVKGLTAITEDGENVLLELMKEGASFRSSGVFTKQVLKRMARRIRRDV
jgi:hypothetical protein